MTKICRKFRCQLNLCEGVHRFFKIILGGTLVNSLNAPGLRNMSFYMYRNIAMG